MDHKLIMERILSIVKDIEELVKEGANVSLLRVYHHKENGRLYAAYDVDPGKTSGYMMIFDLERGMFRHMGFGKGCFPTDWEKF